MSQYYTRHHLRYAEDVKKIVAYLREHGDLHCGLNRLEELWEEFSDEHCAGFLGPNDEWLIMFERWLNNYDTNKYDDWEDD